MTAQTMPQSVSHSINISITPLMALADAALNDGESSASPSSSSSACSHSEEKRESAEAQSTRPPMDKQTFAQQLMTLLDDESSPYLKWMPDGKSFTIKNPKKFTADQMPKVFHIRNMSSFVRKLTRWGFSRHHEKVTMNSDIFKHASFERGQWERCSDMKCASRPPVTVRKDLPKMTPMTTKPVSIPPPAPRPVSPVWSKASATATPTTLSPTLQSQPSPRNNLPNGWKPSLSVMHPPSVNMASMPRRSAFAAVAPRDLLKLDPTTRANLLTLQLLQTHHQQQMTDQQALLRLAGWHILQQMTNLES